jgi:hypothetical protein
MLTSSACDMEAGSWSFMASWSARVLGLMFFAVVLLFFLAHAIAGDLPRIWQEPIGVQVDLLALFLMAIGGVVGWKWPSVASVMVLVGYALWQFVQRRLPWPSSWVEIPLLIGLLYAFASWRTKRLSTPQRQTQ